MASPAVCGWLSLRKKAKAKFGFLTPNKEFEWKRYFFLLDQTELYYYRKSFSPPKRPKKSAGKISLKHTFLNVILKDMSLGEGYLFRIIPLIINTQKLQEGLEDAICEASGFDIVLSADSENELSMWVREILQASALFMAEDTNPRNIALLIQESIRDPRKDFGQEDLLTLSPRGLQSKDDDEDIPTTEESTSFTETEMIEMNALDCIYSFWKSMKLRENYIQQRRNTIVIQSWWRFVYQKKVRQRKERSLQIIQRCWRRHLAMKQKHKETKLLSHRKKIIDELLKTEFSYVDGLSLLISEFRVPLQAMANGEISWDGKNVLNKPGKPLISESNLQKLFSNVDSILILHSLFLSQLEKRINYDWSHNNSSIGDIFTSLAVQFKVYIQYVNNYVLASSLVQELRKEPKVVSFLAQQSANLPDSFVNLPLESLLILPVQRLPRYELLLRDIIQYTRPEHPDYQILQAASTSVNEMATVINESKRGIERMEQSLEIQRQFSNLSEDLLLPHRKYIKHGHLTEVERGKTISERMLFLFTDILIIADKKIKGTFSNTVFYDEVECILLQESDVMTIGEHTFNVGTRDGKLSYSFRAKSPKDKIEWFKLIKAQTEVGRTKENFDSI